MANRIEYPQAPVDSDPGHHLRLKTPAFALGFLLLWAYLIQSAWFTGWRRPFERTKPRASTYGTAELKRRVTQHFDTVNIEK